MRSLTTTDLAADLASTAFSGPESSPETPGQIGAEAEFIPVESLTGRRCPIEGEDVISTLPFLRKYGDGHGWQESRTSKGTPCFVLPRGGSLTYEPGGQLEYSSSPCASAVELLGLLRSTVIPLREAATTEGISLLACGIDPLNSIEQAPLLVTAKRYQRMAQYLARRDEAGARMMRQTAAFQISLDFGDQPLLRWRVLNAAAPYVTAIFANSPIYAGECTGYQSERGAVWRKVDPLRTGIAYGASDPIDTYLHFALNAPAILLPELEGECLPFGEWLGRGSVGMGEWHDHLTTLFPEVRPRGHMELRSADAIHPEWYVAPLALTAGILYHEPTLRATDALLGPPDARLLEGGSRLGLHDPALARVAVQLFELALEGCRHLGAEYFAPADLERAGEFFDRYTRRGRAPADELIESAIAA
jgi:glutamate--cysteine ligase